MAVGPTVMPPNDGPDKPSALRALVSGPQVRWPMDPESFEGSSGPLDGLLGPALPFDSPAEPITAAIGPSDGAGETLPNCWPPEGVDPSPLPTLGPVTIGSEAPGVSLAPGPDVAFESAGSVGVGLGSDVPLGVEPGVGVLTGVDVVAGVGVARGVEDGVGRGVGVGVGAGFGVGVGVGLG